MPATGVTKTGTVKMFDPGRGFGFISCADGREVYFHATGIEADRPLKVGDAVKFVQGFARDGRSRARNVAVLQTVGSRN
jgi:cold shock CspA family protein